MLGSGHGFPTRGGWRRHGGLPFRRRTGLPGLRGHARQAAHRAAWSGCPIRRRWRGGWARRGCAPRTRPRRGGRGGAGPGPDAAGGDRPAGAGGDAGPAVRPDDAAVVNRAAAHPDLVPQLAAGEGGPGVRWGQGRDAGAALATVARDAVLLLGGPPMGRVKECGEPDVLAALPGRLPGEPAALVLDGPLREPRQGRRVPGAGAAGAGAQGGASGTETSVRRKPTYCSGKKDSLFLWPGRGQPGGRDRATALPPLPGPGRHGRAVGLRLPRRSGSPSAASGCAALSLLRLASAALALRWWRRPRGTAARRTGPAADRGVRRDRDDRLSGAAQLGRGARARGDGEPGDRGGAGVQRAAGRRGPAASR